MKDLLKEMEQYIIAPKRASGDYVKMMDNAMDILNKMEQFTDIIPDVNKKNVMKKKITMAQSVLIDSLQTYNDWVEKNTE